MKDDKQGAETILFVDDDVGLVNVMKTMLSSLGYRSICFTNSEEAFKTFHKVADVFDCVIVDMIMPEINGLTLAGMMKEIRPDIPIIMVTGFRERINMQQAEEVGIIDFMDKPIKRDLLAASIRRAIDQRSEHIS